MLKSFNQSSRSIIQTVFLLFFLIALLYALYDVLKVFFGVFTFALIFSVSFGPLFEKWVSLLGNRRKLAGVIYSILLIALIALPFTYIIHLLIEYVKDAVHWLADARANGVPPLPDWIARIPLAGEEINNFWRQFQDSPKETLGLYDSQVKDVLHRLVNGGAGVLGAAVEIIAGIIISAIFLVKGRKLARPLFVMLSNLISEEDSMLLIDAVIQAIKGVSIGVIGTAFIAAAISLVGFLIAGIHFALGLAAIIFFLVLIQVGPLLVWIPLVIYVISQGHTGTAIFIGIYGVFVLAIDAVLKPVLIAKSGKLPFLVLFLGVIGGLVVWGFTGMFKGAIILSIFYTIFGSWFEEKKEEGNMSYER